MTSKGSPDRSRVTKFLDLVELMGGGNYASAQEQASSHSTLYDKVEHLVVSRFQGEAFQLVDLRETFEIEFGTSPSDSTMATYLGRMADRGVLRRSGRRGSYKYRVETDELSIRQE
jgi:hypothetical protein